MCASSFGQNDPMGRAISWSILFMMAAPYTIVGSIAGVLVYLSRRGERAEPVADDLGRLPRPEPQGDTP